MHLVEDIEKFIRHVFEVFIFLSQQIYLLLKIFPKITRKTDLELATGTECKN